MSCRPRYTSCPHCKNPILKTGYRDHIARYCWVVAKQKKEHDEKLRRALDQTETETGNPHENFDRAKRIFE